MDGDLAPLPGAPRPRRGPPAWLLVDDAHGFGVLGPGPRQPSAHLALGSPRLILMAPRQAAGVSGAFVAGSHHSVIEWLVNTSRSYIFTTGAPPLLAENLLHRPRLSSNKATPRRAHLAR